MEFKTDNGFAMRLAEDWVRLGVVPLVGIPASPWLPNPLWFIYFLAPIVAFSRGPTNSAAAVGLVNVAGLLGVLVLARRFFSPLAALAAGLFLATDPWAVVYSRR